MPDMLIAYASTEGHSSEIARHLDRAINARGRSARLLDIKGDTDAINKIMSGPDLSAAIIIGSIHFGDYDVELFGFAKRHAAILGGLPSAFLSVSLSAASDDMAERMAVDKIAHILLQESGWQPNQLLHVAGAVKESELNFFKRGALLAVLRAKGVKPDSSGYTVFTDWDALDRFADDFVELERCATAPESQ